MTEKVHDSDYFRKRAAEARAASVAKGGDETAAIAGELALAYSALARRHAESDAEPVVAEIQPAEIG